MLNSFFVFCFFFPKTIVFFWSCILIFLQSKNWAMMNCGKIIFPSKIFASGHLLNNSSCHCYLQKLTKHNENRHPVWYSFSSWRLAIFMFASPQGKNSPNIRGTTISPSWFPKWSFSEIRNQFHSCSYCFLLAPFICFRHKWEIYFWQFVIIWEAIVMSDCKILKSFFV